MRYTVDKNLGKTAYLQLYEQLREDIVKGLFPFSARLPSKRILSEEIGVSVITVEHAYALLCEEGYVESRQRSGFYVIYHGGEAFSSPVRPLPLALATPGLRSETDDFPFTVFARTMRRVLSDYGDRILIKSPNRGNEILRRELAAYLARSRGIFVSHEQIVIGAGAEYFYGILVQLLGREKRFALEDPSYEKIRLVYEAEGAVTVALPLTADGIEGEALFSCEADVLHVTPYRSFPSGVTATVSKKREYLRWAKKEGRILIEDDFESEFTLSRKPEETIFSMAEGRGVVYMNTFSQTIAPSIRVGYMVLPQELLAQFDQRVGFYSCTVPTFEQLVIASFLSSGEFERHVNRVRRRKRKACAIKEEKKK